MRFDWHTLVLQAVNFAVLVWLLQRFLYRPVLRAVDGRRSEIDKQLADARKAQAEARERLDAANGERAGINAERSQALKAAAEEAERAAAARGAAAQREAVVLLEETRKTLAGERREALAQVRHSALDLAAAYARRLLDALPEQLRSEAWLGRVAEYLSQLPAERRAALTGQLSPVFSLTVTTAAALPTDALESWRKRLSAVVGECAMSFRVDSALGAGVELAFPAANVRFSLRSAIEALRAELERAGGAAEASDAPQASGSPPPPS